MTDFEFHLDEKVTTWYRTRFTIEAKTKEEAIEKAKEFHKNKEAENLPWEQVDEGLIERLPVDENGGYATEELVDRETYEIIYQNGE